MEPTKQPNWNQPLRVLTSTPRWPWHQPTDVECHHLSRASRQEWLPKKKPSPSVVQVNKKLRILRSIMSLPHEFFWISLVYICLYYIGRPSGRWGWRWFISLAFINFHHHIHTTTIHTTEGLKSLSLLDSHIFRCIVASFGGHKVLRP